MKESKLREMSRRALSSNLLGLFVVLILMCVVFTILKPGFLTGKNLLNILTAASLSGLIAIGESYLIIAGQIDLSPARSRRSRASFPRCSPSGASTSPRWRTSRTQRSETAASGGWPRASSTAPPRLICR